MEREALNEARTIMFVAWKIYGTKSIYEWLQKYEPEYLKKMEEKK